MMDCFRGRAVQASDGMLEYFPETFVVPTLPGLVSVGETGHSAGLAHVVA